MKRNIYFKIIIFLACSPLWAQTDSYNPYIPQIIPVSPNAASLGQYGAVPVDYYNGLPEIKIPLYDLNLAGIKIPISMSYHSSGIKVAQEASWVGLGWSLNVGGCIVRDCIGGDDLHNIGLPQGYLYGANREYYLKTLPRRGFVGKVPFYHHPLIWKPAMIGGISLLSDITEEDTNPDIFQFNFSQYTGSMFFNNLASDVRVKNCKDYLKPVFNRNTESWLITDGYGVKYYFGGSVSSRDISSTRYSNDNDHHISEQCVSPFPEFNNMLNKHPHEDIITAWYLDSIVAPNNEKVIFQYKKEKVATTVMSQEDIRLKIPNVDNKMGTPDRFNYFSFNAAGIDQALLSKIIFSNGEISFHTSDRNDIYSQNLDEVKAQKLDKIVISNLGQEVKSYTFDYVYHGNQSRYETCRLLLMQLNERGTGLFSNSYKFSYNMGMLPAKNSRQIDFWGFYNNSKAPKYWGINEEWSSEGTLIPSVLVPLPYSNELPLFMYGRDRASNSEYMQHGILTAIQYPTGGVSHFEYEPHEFENKFYSGFNILDESYRVILRAKNENGRISIVDNYNINNDPSFRLFDINSEKAYCLLDMNVYTNPWGVKLKSSNCAFGSLEIGTFNLGVYDYCNNYHFTGCDNFAYKNRFKDSSTFVLTKGKYQIKIEPYNFVVDEQKPPQSTINYYDFEAVLSFIKERSVVTGGGLRIKRIYNTIDDKIQSDKTFAYKNVNGTSSGHLAVTPFYNLTYLGVFPVIKYNIQEPPNIYLYQSSYLMMRSNSIVGLTQTFSGSPVGYSKVEEVNWGSGEFQGKVEYLFHNLKDTCVLYSQDQPILEGNNLHPDSYTVIPEQVSLSSGENGLLKAMLSYDKNNILVEKTQHFYQQKISDPTWGINTFRLYPYSSVCNCSVGNYDSDYFTCEVVFKKYTLHSEWWRKNKTIVTRYFNCQQDSAIVTKNYLYDDINYLLRQTSTIDSSGKEVISNTNYTSTNAEMKDKNLVNLPVQKSNYVNNGLMEQQNFYYKNNFDQMLLDFVTHRVKDGAEKKMIQYNKYDKKGNPLFITQYDGGMDICYIWGYQGTYPIAEIKNATWTEVINALAGTNLEKLSDAVVPDMRVIENLRTNAMLKKAQITTYTYQPSIGMLTATDPRGVVTHFDYDYVGRLKRKYLDVNGERQILEEYDYHYYNQ